MFELTAIKDLVQKGFFEQNKLTNENKRVVHKL